MQKGIHLGDGLVATNHQFNQGRSNIHLTAHTYEITSCYLAASAAHSLIQGWTSHDCMRAAPRCGHASIAQIASLHILFVRLLPRPSLVTSRRTSYSKSNKVCLSVFSCEPKLDSLHVSLELSRHSFTSISVLRCGHQRSAKKDNSTQRIMNVLTFCVALAALVARAGAQVLSRHALSCRHALFR